MSIVAPQLGVDTMWAEAAVGDDHTCARQHDGSVWCWGDAGNGQLGQGATPFDCTRPSVVAAGSMWLTIDAGADVTCAIAADAGLWCWGLNNVSQLGLGDTMPRDVPTSVAPIGWARLAVGRVHACALKQDGTIWCWGENVHGQIGNATLGGAQSTPAPIAGTWLDLDAGSDFTCALDIDEAVWCWGTGDDGRLGTGTTTDTPVPTRVVAPL